MSDDLRSQRMESAEGRGRARQVWDAYAEAANRIRPAALDRAAQRLACSWSESLLGFWLSWHLYGGFEGLERAGWHRATIYRKLKRFRMVFGKHPDEFQVAGVSLDPQVFWDTYLAPRPDDDR